LSDLFDEGAGGKHAPLADRMRPRSLDDVVGQEEIVGPGRLLRRAIQADRVSSILLYGPPGTGKTSLARVIANSTKSVFESLNAVLTGVKDVREAIDRAEKRHKLYEKRTILFVDEVHRWNKSQQDALLPWVENGTVVLVGATTENPFFEVNKALVSRSRIFQLKALTAENLMETARRALADAERGYGRWKVRFEDGAIEHLVDTANGDARSLLNALELAVETTPASWPPPEGMEIYVNFRTAEESIQKKALLYDRDGDYHFDTISAFIKSLRGSDPDAALYWLAKMTAAGEDPAFIFRRMIISAGEDVGMADPQAIVVVQACASAFERVGFPEGNYQLAQAALYLATAPKSNSTLAFFDALAQVEKEEAEVPNHLRDGSRDKEGFGHGEGYIYPHAFREHWAAQQYLPKALAGRTFYAPSAIGYEGKIRDEVMRKRELQAAIILGEANLDGDPDRDQGSDQGESLSYSAASKGREGWYKRLESGRSATLLRERDAIFSAISTPRHHRVLIAASDDGLLLWEALRRTPEGLCVALVRSEEAREALVRYAATMEEIERPIITIAGEENSLPATATASVQFGTGEFDLILAREPWKRGFGKQTPRESFRTFAESAFPLLHPQGALVLLQAAPRLGERISRILEREGVQETGFVDAGLLDALREAEERYFSADPAAIWAWTQQDLAAAFETAGFRTKTVLVETEEERLLGERDIAAWFDTQKSSWGMAIRTGLGDGDFQRVRELLAERAKRGPLSWKRRAILLTAHHILGGNLHDSIGVSSDTLPRASQ